MYINVDNGGTFTDFWAFDAERRFRVKTRTTPHDLSECLFEGLRLLAEDIFRRPDIGRLLAETKYIRYSTTQGTNALVQRKGPRIGLILASRGIFGAMRGADGGETADMIDTLVGDRVEILDPEVVTGSDADDEVTGDLVMAAVNRLTSAGANRIVVSLGSRDAERTVRRLAARRFPRHLLGTVPILETSDVTGDADRARATWTAVINAFLHPAMERFLYNTDNRLRAMNLSAPLLVFRNDGLAGRVAKTPAIKTYGSGPEGGVCGAEALAADYRLKHFVTVDVGGTTTDFGLVVDGRAVKHRFGRIETVDVSIPMSDLRSIGVGGGSIIRAEGGVIRVGPESVGAAPGPACFGFGGTSATITDVKLMKGVIDPDHYFGGRMTLDRARAENAVRSNVAEPLGLSLAAAAEAMEAAWVEAIAHHLRGYVRPDTVLGAFGGAGPFSICAVADAVGVKRVLVPSMAAVFSASGIGQSDIGQRYDAVLNGPQTLEAARARVEALTTRARQDMFAEGFDLAGCRIEWSLRTPDGQRRGLAAADVAVALTTLKPGLSLLDLVVSHPVGHDRRGTVGATPPATPAPVRGSRHTRLDGGEAAAIPVYVVDDLAPGATGAGPAIVEDPYFTLPVPKGWTFTVTAAGDFQLDRR